MSLMLVDRKWMIERERWKGGKRAILTYLHTQSATTHHLFHSNIFSRRAFVDTSSQYIQVEALIYPPFIFMSIMSCHVVAFSKGFLGNRIELAWPHKEQFWLLIFGTKNRIWTYEAFCARTRMAWNDGNCTYS